MQGVYQRNPRKQYQLGDKGYGFWQRKESSANQAQHRPDPQEALWMSWDGTSQLFALRQGSQDFIHS